jgi:xylulokinase
MSDAPLFIGVDASTSSVRALVVDAEGRIVSAGRAPLTVERIGVDGYEQDAESWWRGLVDAIRAALHALPAERSLDLVALSIAHQRETFVVTDARGQPLAPAMLWMDGRATAEVARAEQEIGAVRLHGLTGKPPCTTPSLFKLMYLLRTRPELRDVACVRDVHSFLSYRLTGRAVAPLGSADSTALLDVRRKEWSPALADLVGVDLHQLPELVESGCLLGPLLPEATRATGLPEGVLVYAGSGDGQACSLGAGVVNKDRGYLDLGTAICSGIITESYQIDQSFRTLHAAIPGRFCLETTLRGGMMTLWWLIDDLLGRPDRASAYEELEAAARSVPPCSEGLLAVPYWSGVMSPYWDDAARGAFLGMHAGHRPEHLFRALLEGMALEERLHLEGIEASTHHEISTLVALGGGSRSDLWCQILADTLCRPIVRSEHPDAAALGVAVLAAVAHGTFGTFEDATAAMVRLGNRFEPGSNSGEYDRMYREVYRGLYHALGPRLGALASFRHNASSKRNE